MGFLYLHVFKLLKERGEGTECKGSHANTELNLFWNLGGGEPLKIHVTFNL